MLQHFWQRWQREYLHQLQPRRKWSAAKEVNLQLGTMVVVHEDNTPPLRWHLGRIMKLHPGEDGITRVVTIRLVDRTIQRSLSKISILPIDKDIDLDTDDQD